MKLEFSWRIFEKYSNIKFHENLSSGSRAVPCGWTDRYNEANSCFFVNAPKNEVEYGTQSAQNWFENLSLYFFQVA